MYRQLIEYFQKVALMHKAVKYSKYMNKVYTNSQNNNGYMQFNIDTDAYFQLIKTAPNEPFTLTLNIDILGFPNKDYTVLDVQNDALLVGVEWLYYISRDEQFYGRMSVYDYSFLALDEYTDDRSAGQRLTVEFVIPNPLNLCDVFDNFSEENIPVEETKDINLTDVNPPSKSNDLVLKPILLPHKS